jgi:glycosyltransferase involved in cell wall biosynthesis
MLKLIVIIPAYNEESTIREVLLRMPDLSGEGVKLIPVVIDDGSTDRTAEIARKCGAKVISHGTNQGVGKSFHDGLEYALEEDADILVNIDADLQYAPEDIRLLIKPILDNKADFVTADRFTQVNGKKVRPSDMPGMNYWGNHQMNRLVNWLAGCKLGDVSSGFRAINREAILNLNLSGKYTYTHETIIDLAMKNLRLVSIPIVVKYYPERKSRVAGNLILYTNRALRIIFKAFRDYRPLYFFSLVAAVPLILGGISLLFTLLHFIQTGDFSPYKFVAFTGVYLFSLGIILIIIGFLADILVGIRLTGERQLYLLKKNRK